MKPGFYWIQIGEQVTVGKRYEHGEWDMLGYEEGAGPEDVGGLVIQQLVPPTAHDGTHPVFENTCDYHLCWCHAPSCAAILAENGERCNCGSHE